MAAGPEHAIWTRKSLVSTILVVAEDKDDKAWIKSKRKVERKNHSRTMCKAAHFARKTWEASGNYI